jgi:hypothetical protein
MIADQLPKPGAVEEKTIGSVEERDGVRWHRALIGRKGQTEQIPVVEVRGPNFAGTVVVWIHPAGKASLIQGGALTPAARMILDHKGAIVAPDVFETGELVGSNKTTVDASYAGFTFGYNRPLLANRVHDILTTVAYANGLPGVQSVDLIGLDTGGPWALLARALCGDRIHRAAIDANRFDFSQVHDNSDSMMLPGALKYGGLPAFAALSAPGQLLVHNQAGAGWKEWLGGAYAAAGAEQRLEASSERMLPENAVAWLLR